jgi:hypothetical protein
MHAVEITNGQHAPVRGFAEIMYAAYQLHVWLKTVKIAKVYLVQRLRLTGDCSRKTESRNDFIMLTFRSEKICSANCDFYAEKLYSRQTSW